MSRPVVVNFIGDATKLHGTITGVESKMGKLKGLIAGLGIGALLAGEFKRSVDAANESNEVSRETEARLKSTGAAAWISAQQVGDLANALAAKTGIDDEQIRSNENLLLTFQSVRNEAGKGNDIFNQATKTILDMSVAFKESGQAASVQLGKALEDPIKNMGALARIGITFTAQQKEQIKTLVESGNKLQAQKVILAAVNAQVAGSAEAAATPYKKLQVVLGNLEENLGNKLVPIINAASNFFLKHTKLVLGAAGAVAALVVVVRTVIAVQKAMAAAQAILNVVMAANPIGLVVIAVAGLIAILVVAWTHSQRFRSIVTGAFHAVTDAASATWGWIKGHWPLLLGILTGPIGPAVVLIVRNFDKIKALPGQMFDVGRRIVQSIIDGIKSRVAGVANAIGSVAQTIRNHLPFSPAKEGPLSGKGSPYIGGQNIARMIGEGIRSGRSGVQGGVSNVLSPVAAGIGGRAGGVNLTINANTNASAHDIAREVAWNMKFSGR
jgi:phage-related protein